MSVKLYKYTSAVRWYHCYRNYWRPVVGEELNCMHERDLAASSWRGTELYARKRQSF